MLGEEIKYAFLQAFGGEDEPGTDVGLEDEEDEDEDLDDENDDEDDDDEDEDNEDEIN